MQISEFTFHSEALGSSPLQLDHSSFFQPLKVSQDGIDSKLEEVTAHMEKFRPLAGSGSRLGDSAENQDPDADAAPFAQSENSDRTI